MISFEGMPEVNGIVVLEFNDAPDWVQSLMCELGAKGYIAEDVELVAIVPNFLHGKCISVLDHLSASQIVLDFQYDTFTVYMGV